VVASIIFKLADSHPETTGEGSDSGGKNGVAWVLRFGGLMALVGLLISERWQLSYLQVGAVISRKVPPTKTEKVN
jgi:solute carrier family 45 protein 1/2/4